MAPEFEVGVHHPNRTQNQTNCELSLAKLVANANSEEVAEVLQGFRSRVEDQQEPVGPTVLLHGGQTLYNLHPLIAHGTFRIVSLSQPQR